METSLKLIQPLSFVELLPYTTHYTSIDSISPMIAYELQYSDSNSIILNLIPCGCTEWIFAYNHNDDKCMIYIIGAVKELTSIALDDFDTYMGIRFSPNTFYSNAKTDSPYEYFNTIHCYIPLASTPEAALIERLRESDCFENRINIINNYIKSSTYHYHISSSVTHMINAIEESNGTVLISQLASDLCYSERHTNRLFIDTFGFGPKDYCKYIRFQNALSEILSNPNRHNSEFIHNIAYSDQAHFQREFKSFTGITPKQYTKMLTDSASLE